MMFSTLTDVPVDNSRVLVRADFDVSIDGQKVGDDYRIRALAPTLRYLQSRQTHVTVIAHLDRPRGYDAALTLRPVARHLENLIGMPVRFCNPWRGGACYAPEQSEREPLVLLENLRFQRGEEENDTSFARDLAARQDIFVNDAFGVCHRVHASVVKVPTFLPSAAGKRLTEEIKVLNRVIETPKRPLVVVIGGVKIPTKLRVVERFLRLADAVLVGGGLANILLSAKGFRVGNASFEKSLLRHAAHLDFHNRKLYLPVDVVAASTPTGSGGVHVRMTGKVGPDETIYDVGPETRRIYTNILMRARTIIWNGVMGYMPSSFFQEGTLSVAEAVVRSDAYTVVGGGSVNAALDNFGFAARINHISTGGGAMLAFLAGDSLPGIEALVASREKFSR